MRIARPGRQPSPARAGKASADERSFMSALGELLDDLVVEARDVVGLAARHDALVDDDLLVDPGPAGVLDVGTECRPRRECPAPRKPRFDEHPRSVADDAHRFPGEPELAYEIDRPL